MNQRAGCLPLAVAILFLVGALQPVAAYVDRSESSAGIQRQPIVAPAPALELRVPELRIPKPASLGRQFAHAIIVRTFPERGTVAPETVGKVEVWYDAGIRDDFVALAVINAAGDRVDKRDAAIDSADQSHVSASVEALTPGEYTVRYRAISADGHIVSGAWIFEVGREK
jgi:copper resistance protein C